MDRIRVVRDGSRGENTFSSRLGPVTRLSNGIVDGLNQSGLNSMGTFEVFQLSNFKSIGPTQFIGR